jgi:hypothetical protein
MGTRAGAHGSGERVQGEFDGACRDFKITHSPKQPRPAWTNGFAERLEGTILRQALAEAFWRTHPSPPTSEVA